MPGAETCSIYFKFNLLDIQQVIALQFEPLSCESI